MNSNMGRPPKYETYDEIQEKIYICDVDNIKTNQFSSENKLLFYIMSNCHNFCIDILQDNLISYENNKLIDEKSYSKSRKIDLFIYAQNNKYIIELKNPKYKSENRKAIGQLLDYGREFKDCKLMLISTKFDIETAKTIKYYNLPIRYIYMDKNKMLEYIHDA